MNDYLSIRRRGARGEQQDRHRYPRTDGVCRRLRSSATPDAYERLVGRARFAVDPDAPAQVGIVDLDKAPRNRDGLVEFAADLCILKPDRSGLQRTGGSSSTTATAATSARCNIFCDAPASNDPMRRWSTPATVTCSAAATRWCGAPGKATSCRATAAWSWTCPWRPTAPAPLTGPVRTEFIVAQEGQTTLPLSGWVSTRSHPTVSRDPSKARLTRRRYPDDERVAIAPDAWQFARLETGVGLDFQGSRAGDRRVRYPHLHAGRIRARLDLRARLRGPRSAGSGPGLRGGSRPRELPEIRGTATARAAPIRWRAEDRWRRPMPSAARRRGG